MKFQTQLLLAVTFCMLLLTGCGGGGSTSGSTTSWASVGVTSGSRQVTVNWSKLTAKATGTATYNLYWSTSPGVTKSNGNKLAAVTYAKADGTTGYSYPGAAYAKQYGITIAGLTTGLEAGNWYQGSVEEIFHLIKNVTMGLSGITTANCDYFNRSMSAVGGTLVRVTDYIWASSEYSSNLAWYFNGSSGALNNSNKNNSYSVRPFIAF